MSSPNKTQATNVPAEDFLNGIKNETRRHDAKRLVEIMKKITGEQPIMWGPSIIGFGRVHYKYESGREGDMGAAGFSPRAASLVIYLVDGTSRYPGLLEKLGPHKTGKVCIYIKKLDEVNLEVLQEIIKRSYDYAMSRKNAMHRAV